MDEYRNMKNKLHIISSEIVKSNRHTKNKLLEITLIHSVCLICVSGSTFHLLATLSNSIEIELGLSRPDIFLGITVMMSTGAFVAPLASYVSRRFGFIAATTIGYIFCAVGLVILSLTYSIFFYYISWFIIGLSFPFIFGQLTMVCLAQAAHPNGRAAISNLMVPMALSGAIYWPTTSLINNLLSWREICMLFSIIIFTVCMPLNYIATQKSILLFKTDSDRTAHQDKNRVQDKYSKKLLSLISISAGLFVGSGIILHIPKLTDEISNFTSTVLSISLLFGIGQVSIRLLEVAFNRFVSILDMCLLVNLCQIVTITMSLLSLDTYTISHFLVLSFGATMGIMNVAKFSLPLEVFGIENFNDLLGRFALPQNIILAFSPYIFSAVYDHNGLDGVLLFSLILTTLSIVAFIILRTLPRSI